MTSTAPLTLYTHPQSRGRVARWALEETGLPYQTEWVEYGAPMKAPAYRAINPMGKVPALTVGDVVVTESAAIVMTLADLVPERRLAPPTASAARGSYYRWISFMGPLEQAVMAQSAGAQFDPTQAGFGTLADTVDTLDQALADREFLVGDHFTMADLLVAAYVGWYVQFKMLEARPNFLRYVERHHQRAAAQRANAIDDAKGGQG